MYQGSIKVFMANSPFPSKVPMPAACGADTCLGPLWLSWEGIGCIFHKLLSITIVTTYQASAMWTGSFMVEKIQSKLDYWQKVLEQSLIHTVVKAQRRKDLLPGVGTRRERQSRKSWWVFGRVCKSKNCYRILLYLGKDVLHLFMSWNITLTVSMCAIFVYFAFV